VTGAGCGADADAAAGNPGGYQPANFSYAERAASTWRWCCWNDIKNDINMARCCWNDIDMASLLLPAAG
jgi:hypothetical protein